MTAKALQGIISSIKISNFKMFHSLHIEDCGVINVIVGQNGAGKTSLLEAIFLALSSSPQKMLDMRVLRGGSVVFSGYAETIIDSIIAEYMHQLDLDNVASVQLSGKGPEARSVSIARKASSLAISTAKLGDEDGPPSAEVVAHMFTWTDENGEEHRANIKVSDKGIEFDGTGEHVPLSFYYPTNSLNLGKEAPDRFTELRRKGHDKLFVQLMKSVFPDIKSIDVESHLQSPQLTATIKGLRQPVPLHAVSGAASRLSAILLAIAHRENGVVLVDEVENGVFYERHGDAAMAMIKLARQFKTQLFLSTHSREWIEAFGEAIGESHSDARLWRLTRNSIGYCDVESFSGRTLRSAIAEGVEVRG